MESHSSSQDEDDAIDLVNHIAPEHVEVLMAEPEHVSDNIKNAGAVFIGRYAPTVVGDYFAGPEPRVADEPDGAILFAVGRCRIS